MRRGTRARVRELVLLGCCAAAGAAGVPAQDEPAHPPAGTADALCELAEQVAADGHPNAALARFDQALALEPDHVRALVGRGSALEDLERFEEALLELERALAAEPEHATALFARGRVHSQLGRPELALADLERAAEALGDDGQVWAWRGHVLFVLERVDEAETCLERAAALAEDDAWVIGTLGHVAWLRGDHARARRLLLRAVELDPAGHWALDVLATVELELGLYDDALRHADRAIALEDGVAEYHYTRSRILSETGRPEEASRALERAIELDPSYRQYAELAAVEDLYAGARFVLWLLAGVLVVFGAVGFVQSGRARRARAEVPAGNTPLRYDGEAGALFALYLKNVVLTLLTVGVYRFWAKVHVQRYRYQHTSFAGGRFDYHATGREKLANFLKGMVVLLPVVAALYPLYLALEPSLGSEDAYFGCFLAFGAVLYFLRPLILVGSQRFNLHRTSWNHLRLRFTGQVGDAYRIYLRDLALIVSTLGIYHAWHQCNVRRFRMQHTRLGDVGFRYTGDGAGLLGILLGGTILCYVTLGLYVPWQMARLHRFHLENTSFQGHRFRTRMTGGHVLSVWGPGLLWIVLSLGLAIPWVLHRWYGLVTDTTSYAGTIDPAEMRSIHAAAQGAMAEGIGEAGEALAELGDLFGG